MPLQSVTGLPSSTAARPVAALERTGGFLWSLSWPGLELTYLSPSAPGHGTSTHDARLHGGPIFNADWAPTLSLPAQLSERAIFAALWNQGWCEFDFALDLDGDETAPAGRTWYRCRALVVQGDEQHGARVDGVAAPYPASDRERLERMASSGHRLSDLAFAAIALDAEARVLTWDEHLADAAGVPADDAVGTPWTTLFTPGDAGVTPGADTGQRLRAFTQGEPLVATIGRKRVLLHHVAPPARASEEARSYILVTVLGDADSSRTGASGGLVPALEATPDEVLLVDAATLSILAYSQGASHAFGYTGQAWMQDLRQVSPDLADIVQAQQDYLALGCMLSSACSVETAGSKALERAAQVQHWQGDGRDLLLVRLRSLADNAPWTRPTPIEADTMPAPEPVVIGTVLLNREGLCQVLSARDGGWEETLGQWLDGQQLANVCAHPRQLGRTIERAFGGQRTSVELTVEGIAAWCTLDAFANDAGETAGLLGTLTIGH